MIQHLKSRAVFYFILIIWMGLGAIHPMVANVVVLLSVFIFWKSNRYFELLLGFIFLLVLSDNLDYFTFAKTFKNVYIVVLGCILFVDRKNFIPFSRLYVGFIPFFLVAFIALLYSGDPFVGVQKTISYLLLLIVAPNYIRLILKQEGLQVFKDVFYFLLNISLAGIVYRFIDVEFSYLAGRYRGLFGNPNGEGIFIYLTTLYFMVTNILYPELYSRNEKRFIWLAILYVLMICGSRSAIISVLIFLMFSRLYRLSPFLGFILLIGIVLGTEVILANTVSIINFLGLDEYFRIRTLEEGSGRFIAWAFAWEKIQEFFIIGGGMGNDEYIMRQNYAYLAKLGHQGGVHNSFLTLWFDVGILGLFLYLGNLLILFLKASRKNKLAFPFFFSVLFSINYESWIAGSLNPFTIILFLVITIVIDYEPEEEIQTENDQLILEHAQN